MVQTASESPDLDLRFPERFASCGRLIRTLLLLQLFAFPVLAARPDYRGLEIAGLSYVADGPVLKLSLDDLNKLIALRPGEPFLETNAHRTVTGLLATELFWDVQVTVEPAPEGKVSVVIRLIRRYTVGRIQFEGETRLSSSGLRRELAFREAEPYTDSGLEETVTRLKSRYRNEGYYQPRIDPQFERDVENARVFVTFQIKAGEQAVLRSLQLETEGGIDHSAVFQLLSLAEGERFSQQNLDADIEKIRHWLSLRGYFHPEIYAVNGLQYDDSANRVDLQLRVVPRRQTVVEFHGISLTDDQLDDLPLYSQSALQRIPVDETVSQLRVGFQQEGYFQARVDAKEEGDEFPPEKIVFTIDRGRKYDLAAIRFTGNQAISSERLHRVLTTTEAGLIERGHLTDKTIASDIDNIQFLYTQNGYLDASIETRFSEDDENLTLEYHITEGSHRTIGKLELAGNNKLSDKILLRDTILRAGEPFSPYALASDRSIILSAYENRGYRNATLDSAVVENPDATVDIKYQISEGDQYFVKSILVAGNLTTNRSVITREVELKPGQPLSLEGALRSETNLYELAVFNRVRVRDLQVDDQDREQPVLIKVDEAKRYYLTYGFGYSHTFGSTASEGARGTLGITDSNFLGRARTLSLNVRAGSTRQRGTLSYALPRLYSYELPTLFSFSIDNENRIDTRQDKILVSGRPYDAFRISASSQVRKILSRRENLIGRWDFERVNLTVPNDPSLPPEFFREEDNLLLSKLNLSYLNDSRDSALNPTRGFFLNGEAAVAARMLGSERQFFKLLTQGRYYFPLFSDVTLVSALRLGAIVPVGSPPPGVEREVPISERFFAGGPGALRGLPLDLAGPLLRDSQTGEVILVGPTDKQVPVALGGDALIVGNLELRFPVYGIFSSVLFYDVGNVFESICTIPKEQFSNDFGIGVAIRSPIGPVRIDFAYNPSPPDLPGYRTWNIHLNIGHPF